MKHKISCSNTECIYRAYHNGCCLKIVCIGKKGECISFTSREPYNELSPNIIDEHSYVSNKYIL